MFPRTNWPIASSTAAHLLHASQHKDPVCGVQAARHRVQQRQAPGQRAAIHQFGGETYHPEEQEDAGQQLRKLAHGRAAQMHPPVRVPENQVFNEFVLIPIQPAVPGRTPALRRLRRSHQPAMPSRIHRPHSKVHVVLGYWHGDRHNFRPVGRGRHHLRELPVRR